MHAWTSCAAGLDQRMSNSVELQHGECCSRQSAMGHLCYCFIIYISTLYLALAASLLHSVSKWWPLISHISLWKVVKWTTTLISSQCDECDLLQGLQGTMYRNALLGLNLSTFCACLEANHLSVFSTCLCLLLPLQYRLFPRQNMSKAIGRDTFGLRVDEDEVHFGRQRGEEIFNAPFKTYLKW